MRRGHFSSFAPHCPACATGTATHPLGIVEVLAEDAAGIVAGRLLCANPVCRHEYPILDGVPVILPDLEKFFAERGAELLLRDDLPASLEGLAGDALGPGSWFDTIRQTVSSYAWDGWADLDPAEPSGPPHPGAAVRCLQRLEEMAGQGAAVRRVLDAGCGAGRTAFAMAERYPDALVLGIDLGPALLRLAQAAMRGGMSYSRRRIGLVYDRRRYPVTVPGAAQVDFWACDAAALPFTSAVAERVVALNLLDCVPDPHALLASLAGLLAPGGRLLLATPYDWSPRATPTAAWIGGHSQRGTEGGAGEPFLRALLTEGAHPRSLVGLTLLGETSLPWHTRLHARSVVQYATHLLALAGGAPCR